MTGSRVPGTRSPVCSSPSRSVAAVSCCRGSLVEARPEACLEAALRTDASTPWTGILKDRHRGAKATKAVSWLFRWRFNPFGHRTRLASPADVFTPQFHHLATESSANEVQTASVRTDPEKEQPGQTATHDGPSTEQPAPHLPHGERPRGAVPAPSANRPFAPPRSCRDGRSPRIGFRRDDGRQKHQARRCNQIESPEIRR